MRQRLNADRHVPEIDGLRTVAVLSVLFYHAGFAPFGGGFVGVDVFFVISGYLITRLIRDEIAATGRFDFFRFYVRRLRRLFPALLATVAGTYVFAALMLSPEQMLLFAASAAAALLSVSNFLFWWGAGYFDALTQTKPLLHTWSLGVEEQFYLFWPALLFVLILKLPRWAPVTALAALCLASVVLAEYLIPRDPDAAFFLLPTRLAELGLGALLVWAGPLLPARNGVREVTLLAGLGLIGWSVVTFTHRTPFPGLNAMAPCLGAALAIHACTARRVGSVLRAAPVVWIGKISYSLYLVHWPVVVYWSAWRFGALLPMDRWAVIAVSVALAAAQFYLVEQRFRYVTPASVSGPRFLAGSAAGALVVGLFSAAVVLSNGWPARIPEDRLVAANRDQRRAQDRLYCRNRDPEKPAWLFTCQNYRGKDRDLVLWGDSHAQHLVAGFSRWFPDYNVYVLFQPGCKPQSGFAGYVRSYGSSATEACVERNRAALAYFETHAPATVVLASAKGGRPEVIAAASREIIDRLEAAGNTAVLLGDTIRPGAHLADCRNVPAVLISDVRLAVRCRPDPATVAEELSYDAALAAIMPEYVPAGPSQCPDGDCRFQEEGELLFRDDHHLTLHGSELFVASIRDGLPPALQTAAGFRPASGVTAP